MSVGRVEMISLGARGHDVVPGPTTPEELGAAAEQKGIRNIQLALGISFPQWSSADQINLGLGSQIRRTLARHGVEIAIMGCYYNMIHPDHAEREAGTKRFEAYLRCAHSFGCGIVASETGSVDPSFAYTERNFTDDAFTQAEQTIERLVRCAEHMGAIVAIEPGVNHPIHDVETSMRLARLIDSDNLGFILDPTALITPELAPRQMDIVRDMLDALGSRIVATHLVDYRIDGGKIVRCNLGEGQLDAEGIISAVSDRCPYSYVITEFTTGDALGRAVREYGATA